jgi:hypothetical protein
VICILIGSFEKNVFKVVVLISMNLSILVYFRIDFSSKKNIGL